jgi:hypothetical protein
MNRLARFWSLTRHEKILSCEASVLLAVSSILIKTVSFRHIDKFLRNRWNDNIESGEIDHEQEIKRVQSSVLRATNALPWRNLCLSRSIAEFVMLRRRGIPAVMQAGVKFSGESSLDAHAWVETGLRGSDKRSENAAYMPVISIGTGDADR